MLLIWARNFATTVKLKQKKHAHMQVLTKKRKWHLLYLHINCAETFSKGEDSNYIQSSWTSARIILKCLMNLTVWNILILFKEYMENMPKSMLCFIKSNFWKVRKGSTIWQSKIVHTEPAFLFKCRQSFEG